MRLAFLLSVDFKYSIVAYFVMDISTGAVDLNRLLSLSRNAIQLLSSSFDLLSLQRYFLYVVENKSHFSLESFCSCILSTFDGAVIVSPLMLIL